MEYTSTKEGSTLTVAIKGRLDTNSSHEMSQFIKENIGGITELIFDLKEMQYFSSTGLRVLIEAQKIMDTQGSMKLKNVNSDAMAILDTTGLSGVFTVE